MKKKGISLIVLVITIIVIIVLATAVLITVVKNNPIQKAKEAVLKNDLKAIEEVFNTAIMETLLNEGQEGVENVYATSAELAEAFPDIKKDILKKFEVIGGKLIFISEDQAERDIASSIGINMIKFPPANQEDWEIDQQGNIITYKGPGGIVEVPSTINQIAVKTINLNHLNSIVNDIQKYSDGSPERVEFEKRQLVECKKACPSYERMSWDVQLGIAITVGPNAWVKMKPTALSKITALKLPEGLVEISDASFANCPNLEIVQLPSTIKIIGANAFQSNEKLAKIIMPVGLEKIGRAAFICCQHLQKFELPSSITTLGYSIVSNSGVQTITIDKLETECVAPGFDANWNKKDGLIEINTAKINVLYKK
ncbi:MAG: leucine-rich repeat domain-containing protein [Clostridia bacterium]